MTGLDVLPVVPPHILLRPDGGVFEFRMPAPLTPGGYCVEVVRAAPVHGFASKPCIVLRGARIEERIVNSAKLMEVRVLGRDSWVDDEGDTITVAALQLVILATQFLDDQIEVTAYMGEPGVADYGPYDDDSSQPLPYWPRNIQDMAPETADRFMLPLAPSLVRVTVTPEWATPYSA